MQTLIEAATAILGLVALVIMIVGALIGIGLLFGRSGFNLEKTTADRVRQQINEDIAKGASPQNALMREYHAQGLSQSRVSFWLPPITGAAMTIKGVAPTRHDMLGLSLSAHALGCVKNPTEKTCGK
jgi:hypothetical protein